MLRQSGDAERSLNVALAIIDDAWEELRRGPDVQLQCGVAPSRLPDVSLTDAQRRSRVGLSLLARIEALVPNSVPHDVELTLRLVRFRARIWSREADWYWTVVDPMGTSFFGHFSPTAYCGGLLLNTLHEQLASFVFTESGDTDRYLALVADYARLIGQFAERTTGQAERGLYMPKVQVQQARALLAAFRSIVHDALSVSPQRLASIRTVNFAREIASRIAKRVEPAFDRAIEVLSDGYLAKAPVEVGLGQYPHGQKVYAELVKLHTTTELSPVQVHAIGQERIAKIEASMQTIRTELGFKGNGAAFVAYLNQDMRWRAGDVEGVKVVFQRYMDRMRPHLNDHFSISPRAPYVVAPLPEALQGSMTYGYYDAPRRDRDAGLYLFNAGNLTKQALFSIGSLTYHELVPGHHLHLASQQENEALHPFRKYNSVNAYNEGWAEYAATFAGEIGLYEQPEERYGRLLNDAFLTIRLVVDTGMNSLGWSLDRAQEYMRQHSGMTEAEILTESIRYSCDTPGQALAYKIGDTHILSLRERMRQTLGEHFDLKDFHSAILGPGALPLPDLTWHVEREIDRLKARK